MAIAFYINQISLQSRRCHICACGSVRSAAAVVRFMGKSSTFHLQNINSVCSERSLVGLCCKLIEEIIQFATFANLFGSMYRVSFIIPATAIP